MKQVKVKTDKLIRVVGYYGKVSDMNNGKRREYEERKVLKCGGTE